MASPNQLPPQVGDTANLLLKKLVTATQSLGGSGGIFLTVAEANALYAKQLSNLSDLSNLVTARANLGVSPTGGDTTYAFRANNLSDLADFPTARTNLGTAFNQVIAKAADFVVTLAQNGAVFNVTTGASNVTATLPVGASGMFFVLRKADAGAGIVLNSGTSTGLAVQGHTLLVYWDPTTAAWISRSWFGSESAAGALTISAGGTNQNITLSPSGSGTTTTSKQITSTVATGTAPFVVASTTLVANLHAAVADSATAATDAINATNIGVTDDTTTNATMYPLWVTAATGNLPAKLASTKLSFNPSTGTLTSTVFSGSGASLTGVVTGITGTAGQITASASTGAVTISIPSDMTGIQTITGLAGNMTITAGTGNSRTLTLRVTDSGGTANAAITIAGTSLVTFGNGAVFAGALTGVASLSGPTSITGGAGNMTFTSGTGASRTLILKTTTSGSIATTALTLDATQQSVFSPGGTTALTIGGTSGAATLTGGAGSMTITAGTGASRTLILQTTTSGSTATTALTLDATQNATFAGNITLGASTSSITGAAGNMTILAGTGNSRTLALQTTTSGGVATTALTLSATQAATFASTITTAAPNSASAAAWTLGDVSSGTIRVGIAGTTYNIPTNGGAGRMTADATNATATMSNLTNLAITVANGIHYVGVIQIFGVDSVGADGFALDMNGGSGSTSDIEFGFAAQPVGSTLGTVTSTGSGTPITLTVVSTADAVYTISFAFTCNSSGTVIPRFAQNSHSTGTATVRKNSSIMVMASSN